jgi:DNA repair protein RadD
MQLRDYQRWAIDQTWRWLLDNDGHPCLVLPTGAGKSHVVAVLCKEALQGWPNTRILMLTNAKELIGQNAEKMVQHWPGAPLGIYSASLKMKQLGNAITFAGIQSIGKKADLLGHIDLVLIDEAHTVSHKDQGLYRTLLDALLAINPAMRIIGLTATPYRLGHGMITDKPALFDGLVIPKDTDGNEIDVAWLIERGFLAPLRSKPTSTTLDVKGVHKRGGDYIESELQAAVNTPDLNAAIADQIIAAAGSRRSWLLFCAGVEHARDMALALHNRGIESAVVHGGTPQTERERILADFKAGRITAVTNCSVLTTGFDAPNIDLIAMLRPTMSAGLYVQMAGRGLRLKDHTDHCLVLDFAGVVRQHGPIINVEPPDRKGEGTGDAPVKTCEHCQEINHASARNCVNCGEPFPVKEPEPVRLYDDDIMGLEPTVMQVQDWQWFKHVTKKGHEGLRVTYYDNWNDKVTEWLITGHDNAWAANKAIKTVNQIAASAGAYLDDAQGLDDVALRLTGSQPPSTVEYTMRKAADGKKFPNVIRREWNVQAVAKVPEMALADDGAPW